MLDGFVLLSLGSGLSGPDWTTAGLWLAVIASGLYHGLNPGMGWPLAVSAGLMQGSTRAVVTAVGYLAAGHLAAMLAVMLPFALLATLVVWQREVQIAASLVVIGFGAYLLLRRRHPRMLARIRPSQLVLWSGAIALAHGAGLMLVPVFLGLCRTDGMAMGHPTAGLLAGSGLGLAVLVSSVHTLAMTVAGGALAWLVYRYLGLTFMARSWFNLDAVWASSLILIGVLALAMNASSMH